MFFEEPTGHIDLVPSMGLRFALVVTGIGTIGLGIFAEPFIRLAGMSLLR